MTSKTFLLPGAGTIAWTAGALAFLLRVSFLFRYDLHFGGDSATCYLMALRIAQGDRPLYFYGQDYQGAPEAYLAAGLFRVFGPSIPLAGAVSLLEWSLAVVCGTYLAVRGTTRGAEALAGLVAAVGVPYTLHYATVPYWGYPAGLLAALLLPLEALFILERGPSPGRFFLLGLTLGLGWYTAKQCLPARGRGAAGVGCAALAGLVAALRTAPVLWRPLPWGCWWATRPSCGIACTMSPVASPAWPTCPPCCPAAAGWSSPFPLTSTASHSPDLPKGLTSSATFKRG